MPRLLPRILCVDDEPEILEILSEYFADQGFAVRTAANAQQAIFEVKRWMPKAIIVDFVMPGLGGLETIEEIRKINPGIVVVLMSGRVDVRDIATDTRGDVAAAFTKPLDLASMLTTLRAAGVGTRKSPPREAVGADMPRRRILVVDDDVDVGEVLAEYLERKGFDVSQVTSGEEAVEHVRQSCPEMVLLDIIMPGLNGVDTLRHIRALSAETPVIMVSANADVETARQTLAIGAADYVPKPVDFGYLDSVLAMHGLDRPVPDDRE